MNELSTIVEDNVLANLEILLNISTNVLNKTTQDMDMRSRNLVINCFVANLVNAMVDTNPRGTFYDYCHGTTNEVKPMTDVKSLKHRKD